MADDLHIAADGVGMLGAAHHVEGHDGACPLMNTEGRQPRDRVGLMELLAGALEAAVLQGSSNPWHIGTTP